MTTRVAELRHVDMHRVAVGFSQTRKAVRHGMYASLTPLRFRGGSVETVRRGRKWIIQRLMDESGQEMLYILTFYLPRFLDLGFREKLTTVVHELWHVGPRFDGDLRRFSGRCYAHSGSQSRYEAHVKRLAEKWLGLDPPADLHSFLRHDFRSLAETHGKIFGRRIPTPKLLPQ
jgi:predicted metallopeptidase